MVSLIFMGRQKYLLPFVSALLLISACTSETQTQLANPVPVEPQFSTPAVLSEPDFVYSNGSAPGGANDCSKGLWLFSLDYQLMNGDVVQGENASAFCEDEIEMRARDGSLEVQRSGQRIESGAVITFLMSLQPNDLDASECVRLYGTTACN